ncbi:CehA/McbA family metallohydrolase [Verrucomicrobium spinosum]|uniref:CehA/McbA family metallohydrolase n=1 Tax=Verrucomicrobium spinosum TaxID=2736 RepID=UPI0001746909|nr:CehA/McbA family metallohydrolase [Verrucomicrobium spinosum]
MMNFAPLTPRWPLRLSLLAALIAAPGTHLHAAEAFEVGAGREAELPVGKEADGIRGDFVLRNDKITALVSQNAPLRRANMSTFYGEDGVTPGCLYDLALRDKQDDQLIYFGPAGQRGQVSYVKIVEDGKQGECAVETVITAAKNGGVYKRHEYRVRDGEQGLRIQTTLRNEGKAPVKVSTKDAWTRFNETGERDGVTWADAVDPDDRIGYAYGKLSAPGAGAIADEVELQPGQVLTWVRFLAIGRSPAEAWSAVRGANGVPTGRLELALAEADGTKPVTGAGLVLEQEINPGQKSDGSVVAYPDSQGLIALSLPSGTYHGSVEEAGRLPRRVSFTLNQGGVVKQQEKLEPATRLKFVVQDARGQSLPCKVQILATGETKPLNLGPVMRAHGCKDQYHSEKGEFSVQVPAGTYKVVVTRGIEYSHHEQEVALAQGQELVVDAKLARLVDTTGWISTDFHNHSTPSGDNICGTADRLINIAAEHLEFTPTTEHNRIYDWRPTIERLGLSQEIQTVVGMELTGSGSHFNCFPLNPVPFVQDGGAPVWNADPRITALTLRGWQGERQDRWVQINHPDMAFLYNDRHADGVADGGYLGITEMVNGMETENFVDEGVLADSPWRLTKAKNSLATRVETVRQFIWLQMLNQGHRIHPVAVADAHAVHGNGVGGWRMYLPSKTDEPAKIDWTNDLAAHALAGHFILTTGPFLQVTAGDGKLPGDDVRSSGVLPLKVKVQCTDWIDIDRVQILVNGRKEPSLNFTRATHPHMFKDGVVKFDQTIPVKLGKDAHLIVVALLENGDLKTGYGTSGQAKLRPMAYHTPFYVDVDGHGFQANGDNLGYDVPVAKMTPDEVRAKMGK